MKLGKVIQIEGINNISIKRNSNSSIENIESNSILINYEFSKYLTKIPAIDVEDLIGRQADLARINGMLQSEKNFVLVNGVGGIGKTTLAKAYLKQYSNQYNHIVWIQCHESIKKTITQNEVLIANLFLKEKENNINDVFEEIVETLLSLNGNNLIVVDNAEIVNDLEAFLDRFSKNENWNLLVTSRDKNSKGSTFQLNKITLPDAKALFYHFYTLEINDDKVEEIIALTEYNILTIELFAKTGQKQKLSLDQIYQSLFNQLIKPRSEPSTKLNLSTINDSFPKLKEAEKIVLLSFSVLPPQKYSPNEILFFLDKITENKSWSVPIVEQSISRLEQKGWLVYGNTKENLTIHAFISEFVTRNLRPNLRLKTKFDLLEYKKTLKEIVSENKIKEAADKLLLGIKRKDEHNEIVLILSRLEDINKKTRMGLVYERDAEIVRNQIRYSFLQLIDRVENLELEYYP